MDNQNQPQPISSNPAPINKENKDAGFYRKTNWKYIVVVLTSVSITALFIIAFIQNLDLLFEYTKSNFLFGWLYFLYQLVVHFVTQYSLLLVALLLLLFTVNKAIRSKLLAILYFVLPLLPLPFIIFLNVTPLYIPIVAIFFLVGFGIWKSKIVALISAAILNIFLTVGGIILLKWTTNISCEGFGCIGLAIPFWIGSGVVIFSLFTTPLLWYQIRMKSKLTNAKRVLFEVAIIELSIVVTAGADFGSSYLDSRSKIQEHRAVYQPRWDRERLEEEQAFQRAIKSGQILYPSNLPWGWKKEAESVDRIRYVKYGVERQVLQVKQSSRSPLGGKTLEELGPDYPNKEQTFVNNEPAVYVTWHTAACTITDEIRELWWYDGDTARALDCSCPCTLSKSELIEIAESMQPAK